MSLTDVSPLPPSLESLFISLVRPLLDVRLVVLPFGRCTLAIDGVNTAMLYMELKRERSESGATKRWVPLLLSLVAVLIVALSQLHPTSPIAPISIEARDAQNYLRGLEREERETVIFDLQRLSDETPALRARSLQLADQLLDEKSAVVDAVGSQNAALVRREANRLVIASRFFQADVGAQQLALRIVLTDDKSDAGEIAVRPEATSSKDDEDSPDAR